MFNIHVIFFLGLGKILMMQLVFLNRNFAISKEHTTLALKTVGQRGLAEGAKGSLQEHAPFINQNLIKNN